MREFFDLLDKNDFVFWGILAAIAIIFLALFVGRVYGLKREQAEEFERELLRREK